ncbi:MAG: hypothetical protein JSS61_05165 [Verrucomicrobia bacterium]|nr:hypothetical protein [Verrucomicrobiota bacterium]
MATSALPSQTTYLERCRQELDLNQIDKLERHSKMWKVAATASLVAFSAIALSAFVLTGIYAAPIYLSFAALSIVLSLPGAVNLYRKFEQVSNSRAELAHQARGINQSYATLITDPSLGRTLDVTRDMGIPWVVTENLIRNPESIRELAPLMARVKYYKDEIDDALADLQTCKEKLAKGEDTHVRALAFMADVRATNLKVKAAFESAVIQQPAFTGSEADLFILEDSYTTALQRAIGRAIGEENLSPYLTFKNGSIAPISYDDAKQMTIPQIAERIFQSMQPQNLVV